MTSESRHISEWIDRPAGEVYDYASDPADLPQWAPGLGSSVENVDGRWFVETSMGRVGFAFAPRNDYGILDHDAGACDDRHIRRVRADTARVVSRP